MGRALLKADIEQFNGLIKDWTDNHNISIPKNVFKYSSQPETCDNSTCISATNGIYSATWKMRVLKEGLLIDMTVKPRLLLLLILNLIYFLALSLSVQNLMVVIEDYNLANLSRFTLFAVMVMLVVWLQYNCLWIKLTKVESSFWESTKENYDTKSLTLSEGKFANSGSRIIMELFSIIFAVYICTTFLGIWGFSISLILCLFVFSIIIADSLKGENPHWHWRIWVIENMAKWTFLMIQILVIFLCLFLVEIFAPLRMYENSNAISVVQAIKEGRVRNITPATAELLEEDCYEYFCQRVDSRTVQLDKLENPKWKKTRAAWVENKMNTDSAVLLFIVLITLCFFSIRPFYLLLRGHDIWKHQANERAKQQSPHVPYISQSWNWQFPLGLRALIFFHYIVGGLFNIAVTVFSLDSLSYACFGKTFILSTIANLWAWPFTAAKILLGIEAGQKFGTFLIIVISLPFLFLLITFIRRTILNLIIILKVLLLQLSFFSYNEEYSYIGDYIKNTCSKFNLTMPTVIITRSKQVIIRIHSLSLIGKSAIEISTATVDLLDDGELKGAVAHELGHIRQGLWKVSILKLLSSLAMFPNYYLTLCINWANKEIDADRFAVAITGQPKLLKHALVKISTAQCFYSKNPTNGLMNFCTRPLMCLKATGDKLNSMFTSVKFYFGDRLFGYAHPYLSERIRVIDENLHKGSAK